MYGCKIRIPHEPCHNRVISLHIRPEHTVFTGGFGFTSQHLHGALVLLIGLSGTFNIQLPGQELVPCRSALIDANVDHSHRKIFGVTPSKVLGNLDEFRVFV